MNPLFLTSMAAVSTSVGGYCALLLHRRVNLLMAFGAGVLVGAALLDLLPSALSAAATRGGPKAAVFPIAALGGLLIFSIGEVVAHYSRPVSASRVGGRINASLLIVHSALDGTAIFAASTNSLQMGLVVGLGVVAHDICDGLNTVLLSTGGQKARWSDYSFLAVDALAPIAGGFIAAHLFPISPAVVMFFLSLAAGSFLFTAMFSLLPGAWQDGRNRVVPLLGAGGFLLVLCLTKLLGALG
ncbi:MAG TPA: zinc permease [Terracidiphilus sp.]|jgi:zinc transporter ZupT